MKLNQRSSTITEGPSRAPARAMMKALGLTDDDLKKTNYIVGKCFCGHKFCQREKHAR